MADALSAFHEPVRRWFAQALGTPTRVQAEGWPPIAAGESALLLAPTGSGKTLAAFLAALNRLAFSPEPPKRERLRVLYVSPLKALANDVEKNLIAPITGIERVAQLSGAPCRMPSVALRTGDTPSRDRAAFLRAPADILITTPESLFLLLTSNARERLATVDTVIVDEIHTMVATKRGAHLFLSLERLEALRGGRGLQRIGLSATQRPLDEVARLLGGGTLSSTSAVLGGQITIGNRDRAPREDPARPAPLASKARSTHGRSPVGSAAGPGGMTQPSSEFGESPATPETESWKSRPVRIVDAGSKKQLDLTVEVPIEDMTAPGFDAEGNVEKSVWPAIHPRLVELIRAHRSTLLFVNSRRLAERLAAAINETAGEEIALAHHGSVAREQRVVIEDRLKRGSLPALVATSSLELGIDMGAIDLVVQIESPPSVASGMQRVGRAGHSVGEPSRGVILPKHRGDLPACAAVAARMRAGQVEETRVPKNPLDVLAQQIVAIAAMDDVRVDDVFDLVRRAAPFSELPRSSFEGVLDMLSGRYPSDEFAELRPRLTWDRVAGTLRARRGAKRLAVVNAGTIPDRGLYGVFLADGGDARSGRGGAERESRAGRELSRRVGELDEEMVFESRAGEIIILGASSWRIDDITHDRVLVTPAPGEPGRLPFWHGDRPGRAAELGRAVGEVTRKLAALGPDPARQQLQSEHGFDARAANNLVAYLSDQREAAGVVPSDREIVVERFLDEIGDWRVCVLSPYGARVHAPWALAASARYREATGLEVECVWSDDGIVMRFAESDEPPSPELLCIAPDEIDDRVTASVGTSALFAARFRENAGRALLLPRKYPGKRSPLWAQRKRAADLLGVAARYGSFPILLETYRECLSDVFDLPALRELLAKVQSRAVRLTTVDSKKPSPFAASLLFGYVGNFMYEGDAPLAERRAAALSIDHAQLRELLGEAELRELLDPEAIEQVARIVGRLDDPGKHPKGWGRPAADEDGICDLLLALGPLTAAEIAERAAPEFDVEAALSALVRARRAIKAQLGERACIAAAEDAARLRDALGVVPAPGLPAAFLEPVADPLGDLVSRYARTHGPFLAADVARHFAIGEAPVRDALARLQGQGRVVEGELLPAGRTREWCAVEVLRQIKQRSLAKLRSAIEPVEPAVYARFLAEWQGLTHPGRGPDALLGAVEQLQGAPLSLSDLEQSILPARVSDFSSRELDLMCATGELVWRGLEPLGASDGRIALYASDAYALLAPPPAHAEGELCDAVRAHLSARGASFFHDIVAAVGGFAPEVLEAVWDLVWAGEVTNDTLAPLRSRLSQSGERTHHRGRRVRRAAPAGSEGRWSLLPHVGAAGDAGANASALAGAPTETERRTALVNQLLERWGVLLREAAHAEGIEGGFSAIYPVLKAMEEAGKLRRGYFVAGLGATQFARPGADDRLRAVRRQPEAAHATILAATDPAQPHGAVIRWPDHAGHPARAAGAKVILIDGELCGYLGRGEKSLLTFLPEEREARGARLTALARALSGLAHAPGRRALLIAEIDGASARESELAPALRDAGFVATAKGLFKRTPRTRESDARDVLGDA